ncbi:MAG: hypothetical protein HC821_00315 [Lewinella sp.]|nr:hypothetical protein [Lewinella sp.]
MLRLFLLWAALALGPAALAAQEIFAFDNNARLCRFDLTTGQYRILPAIFSRSNIALTTSPDGLLYTVVLAGPPIANRNRLFEFDLLREQFTEIAILPSTTIPSYPYYHAKINPLQPNQLLLSSHIDAFYFDLNTNTSTERAGLFPIPQAYEYFSEKLFVIARRSLNGTNFFAQIDPLTFQVDSLPYENLDGAYMDIGLTSLWKQDCSGKDLISTWDHPTDTFLITFALTDTATGQITPLQEFVFDRPLCCWSDQWVANLTSYEAFRQVCEVRLDLDGNDSNYRLGPHFQKRAVFCASRLPLADEDVRIWTVANSPIDSLSIRLAAGIQRPGTELLRFVSSPFLNVINVGDTLLRVFPAQDSSPPYSVWESFVQQMALEFSVAPIGGMRQIHFQLFSAGLGSDLAKAFIAVDDRNPSAGDDKTLQLCPNVGTEVFQHLGPNATPGGYWQPALDTSTGSAFFVVGTHPYGSYNYILALPGCIPDTATLTIQRRPDLAPLVPFANDTVTLCGGDTLFWNPVTNTQLRFVQFSNPNVLAPPLPISRPGTYSATVLDRQTNCFETVQVFVRTAPDGTTLSGDTIPLGLCPGSSLTYGPLTIQSPGYYLFTDTLLGCARNQVLNVSPAPTYLFDLDTLLAQGSSIAFGNLNITAPGSYVQNFTTTLGCDSIVKLDVELISGLEQHPSRLNPPLRPVNPISQLADFRLLDPQGQTITTAQLRFFDARGRLINANNNPQPPGLYFFKCIIPSMGQHSFSGKVLVSGNP